MPADHPRICVINDNPEFLELMTEILGTEAEYAVTTFKDTTSIDELAAAEPDLIIVDLLLGGASGWDVVALSRADKRLADVPILVCSADVTALHERAEEFERIGQVHILEKPFSIAELTELVERLLGRETSRSG